MAFEVGFAPVHTESAPPVEVGTGRRPVDGFDQLKGQFLASLNHELRTPLSGVIGMADLLRETRLEDDQREYVHTIRECAEQLLETLNTVLEYSTLASGGARLSEQEFSLTALLAGAVEDVRPKAEAKGLETVLEIAGPFPELVEADARYLRQIVDHLLRNAVKFTPNGKVGVAARWGDLPDGGPWVEIEVRDTGIGIPPAKQRLIFEEFRQLDQGLSRTYAGLGLGLALTKRIVTMMGGDIEVASEPGLGSSFTVRVPVRIGGGQHHPAHAAAPGEANVRSPRVLVVDDSRVSLQVVSTMLRRAGCTVAVARSGREGIEKAFTDRFDLILMDMQMPDTDGLAATLAIRGGGECADVPILALTANATEQDRQACFSAGMQGFLSKPVHRDELLASISVLISHTGAVTA
jgi:CheY-like chemotaxis protein